MVMIIAFGILPTENTYAKNVTDEEVRLIKERNVHYRDVLENGFAFASWRSIASFGLVDLNGDGLEELAANMSDKGYRYPLQIETYDGAGFIGGDTEGGIYYCESTKNILICEGYDIINNTITSPNMTINIFNWKSNEKVYEAECIYEVNYIEGCFWSYEEITLEEINEQNIPKDELVWTSDEYGNVVGSYRRKIKHTGEEVKNEIDKYLPTKTIVESPYENTPENRDKYLPTDEATIRTMLEAKYGVEDKEDDSTNNKPDNNQSTQNQPTQNQPTTNQPTNSQPSDSKNEPTNEEVVNSEETGNAIDKIVSKNDEAVYINGINATFANGANLESQIINDSAKISNFDTIIKNEISDWSNRVYFELNLSDNNQTAIEQLDGTVTVHVIVPFRIEAENLVKIFRIEDNKLIECPSKVVGNEVAFETDHFSTYAIIEVVGKTTEIIDDTESTEDDILTESPTEKEPENAFPWGVVIFVVVLVLVAGAVAGKVLYDKYAVRKDNE